MMRLTNSFLALIILCTISVNSYSRCLALTESQQRYKALDFSSFIPDAGTLSIEDYPAILKSTLVDDKDTFAPMYDGGVYWLIFDVCNKSARSSWYLHVNNNLLSRMDALVLDADVAVGKFGGDYGNLESVTINPLGRAFQLSLPVNEYRRVVLRLDAELYDDATDVLLMTGDKYHIWSEVIGAIVIFCAGIIIGLSLYNLVLFVFVRESLYLWLFLATVFYIFPHGLYSGYWQELFGYVVGNRWVDMLANYFISIPLLLFCGSYLRLEDNTPHLRRCFQAMFIIVFVTPVTISFLTIAEFSLLVYLEFLLAVLLFIITGIRRRTQGFKPASYIVIAFLPLLIQSTIWNSEIIGLQDFEILISGFVGSSIIATWAFLFMSIGLSERIRLIREEKMQAERASLSKTQFLAAASHDLRQPLHALGLFISSLSPHVQGSAGQEILLKIRNATESMAGLFNSLLDLSRLDAGAIRPEFEDCSINQLLFAMESEFSALAADRGLQLRIVECTEFVRSDPALLERILRNLISNAIRYTGSGRVVIGCRQGETSVSLQVHDTGRGIDDEKLEDVFEEFSQLQPSSKNSLEGLGLGLNIVKRTASLLGHPLKVTSKPGKGSCFSIELNKVQQHVELNSDTEQKGSGSIHGMSILVIDNDESVLLAMETLLENWDCHVITAKAITEGIDKVQSSGQQPDLILADYELEQDETGIQAIARLRTEFSSNTPAAIITGTTISVALQRDKPEDILVMFKPVQPAQLRSLLLYTRQQHN